MRLPVVAKRLRPRAGFLSDTFAARESGWVALRSWRMAGNVSRLRLIHIKAEPGPCDDTGDMTAAAISPGSLPAHPHWRDLVLPKEHGSWSLALEPLALGLLVAPSLAGGALAVAAFAGFLARRPLKIAVRERRGVRRATAIRALAVLVTIAGSAFALAVGLGGTEWLGWLVPVMALGAVFAGFDLGNAWRTGVAEVAGAAAFALLAGTVAGASGWPFAAVWPLAFAMLGRAVPTVLFVRAAVRARKTGEICRWPALAAASAAVGLALGGWSAGMMPGAVAGTLGLLLARTAILLWSPRLSLRPRTLGFAELALGVAYLALVAAAWPRTV